MANQWADATALDNWAFATGTPNHYENTDGEWCFSEDDVTDPPPGMTGYRQVWHSINSATSVMLAIQSWLNAPDQGILGVWSRVGGAWADTVVTPTDPDTYPSISAQLDPSVDYYVMFAWVQPFAQSNFYWQADLLPAADHPDEAPPIRLAVTIFEDPASSQLSAPPIKAAVGVAGDGTLPAPFDGTLTPSLPVPGAQLPMDTPNFVVGLTSSNPNAMYTIVVQYADDEAFTNPVTLSGDSTAITGGVSLAPPGPVPATTYWRTRLEESGTVLLDWSATMSFTVVSDPSATAGLLDVTWNVTASAGRPIHFWHYDPPGPSDGDTVTIYGQGLPATGTLLYGETVLQTTSWQLIAASPDNADDSTRFINGNLVTPEHYEVQFIAPVDDGPGDVLVLEG